MSVWKTRQRQLNTTYARTCHNEHVAAHDDVEKDAVPEGPEAEEAATHDAHVAAQREDELA